MPDATAVRLRIVLKSPTAGAYGGVQIGSASKATVPDWHQMTDEDHTFELEVQAKDGKLPLTGKPVQRDSKGRFVYIVWRGGEISRRAKIYIESITQAMIDRGESLTIILPGQAKDGWPCCATVKPIQDWH